MSPLFVHNASTDPAYLKNATHVFLRTQRRHVETRFNTLCRLGDGTNVGAVIRRRVDTANSRLLFIAFKRLARDGKTVVLTRFGGRLVTNTDRENTSDLVLDDEQIIQLVLRAEEENIIMCAEDEDYNRDDELGDFDDDEEDDNPEKILEIMNLSYVILWVFLCIISLPIFLSRFRVDILIEIKRSNVFCTTALVTNGNVPPPIVVSLYSSLLCNYKIREYANEACHMRHMTVFKEHLLSLAAHLDHVIKTIQWAAVPHCRAADWLLRNGTNQYEVSLHREPLMCNV